MALIWCIPSLVEPTHFCSSEIWYTLDPLGSHGQGWFGQHLNQAGFTATDLPNFILGSQVNQRFTPSNTASFAFRGLNSLVLPLSGNSTQRALKRTAFEELYQESGLKVVYDELSELGQLGATTVTRLEDYYQERNGLENAGAVEALLLDGSGRYRSSNPLVYDSPLNHPNITGMRLVRDLRHVAAAIRADVGACFYHVGIGGLDTHSQQEVDFRHSNILYQLSEAVAAFYKDMDQSVSLPGGYSGYRTWNLANDVIIIIDSEFGRTKRQNSTNTNEAGTDHAASAPLLPLGKTVIGGQYGAYPLLEINGARSNDLTTTTDFRDVYGTVLNKWLGISTSDLGPGPDKLLPDTPFADGQGDSYTAFNAMGFLP